MVLLHQIRKLGHQSPTIGGVQELPFWALESFLRGLYCTVDIVWCRSLNSSNLLFCCRVDRGDGVFRFGRIDEFVIDEQTRGLLPLLAVGSFERESLRCHVSK